ncbi:MAG: hypothetical protein C0483_11130 [Pirellula sp.]|nr:hypothetical protein [Pirellula sp.]
MSTSDDQVIKLSATEPWTTASRRILFILFLSIAIVGIYVAWQCYRCTALYTANRVVALHGYVSFPSPCSCSLVPGYGPQSSWWEAYRLSRYPVARVDFSQSGPLVDDETLPDLARLGSVNYIDLRGTRITGRSLARVATVPDLTMLDVPQTPLCDGDLIYLHAATKLQVLEIDDTAIADGAVAHLAAIPNLQAITCCNTRLTEAGVKELKRLRPDIAVIHESTSSTAEDADR